MADLIDVRGDWMLRPQFGGHQLAEPSDGGQDVVEVPLDYHEQVVEVVGDTAGEAADRLHPLGLGQLSLERAFARDVPGYRDGADHDPGRVPQRRDGHVQLDSRSVLAPLEEPAFPRLTAF